jgi:hypothetical protein
MAGACTRNTTRRSSQSSSHLRKRSMGVGMGSEL